MWTATNCLYANMFENRIICEFTVIWLYVDCQQFVLDCHKLVICPFVGFILVSVWLYVRIYGYMWTSNTLLGTVAYKRTYVT